MPKTKKARQLKQPRARSALEIQHAHDLLHAVLAGEFANPLPRLAADTHLAMGASLNVLCWVLSHRHNTNFGDRLADLEEIIRRAGYTQVNLPALMPAALLRKPAGGDKPN